MPSIASAVSFIRDLKKARDEGKWGTGHSNRATKDQWQSIVLLAQWYENFLRKEAQGLAAAATSADHTKITLKVVDQFCAEYETLFQATILEEKKGIPLLQAMEAVVQESSAEQRETLKALEEQIEKWSLKADRQRATSEDAYADAKRLSEDNPYLKDERSPPRQEKDYKTTLYVSQEYLDTLLKMADAFESEEKSRTTPRSQFSDDFTEAPPQATSVDDEPEAKRPSSHPPRSGIEIYLNFAQKQLGLFLHYVFTKHRQHLDAIKESGLIDLIPQKPKGEASPDSKTRPPKGDPATPPPEDSKK